ncbi:MAG: NADH-quinone oxidoreductase subunit N [Deltaproteobacteria bacterium]|nr:NADH-quinone oxidoreductase subunit N [Deltaproteobacteria bacterium]
MQTLLNINWMQFLFQSSPWGLSLVGALIILLVGPFLKKPHRFSFGVAFATVLASLWLAWTNWMQVAGDNSGLFLFDKITYLFVLFFLIAAGLTLLLSYSYLKMFGLARPEYYSLLLFAVFGMGCMVAASDLMVFFLGLEIMSVALYVLAGFQRSNSLCVEASLKYFLIGAFASAFLLLGIAFIYGASGTTDLVLLHEKGMALASGDTRTYMLLGLSLLAVGLGFKIAAVPFHFWAADVYEGSPVVVTTFMATAVKAAGFAALLRIIWALFQWEPMLFTKVIWIGAALTMTIGNIAALVQKNMKRMLAYSSIAHAGYALVPLVAFANQSAAVVSSVAFYLLAYILMTTGAFAVLISLTGEGKENCRMSDLTGLGYKKPFLGFVMTFFMLSLAGMPPTMGFFGKYYMFLQAVQTGYVGLAVLGVLNSVVSVYYYLGPVVAMYFGKETEETKGLTHIWIPQSVLAVIWLAFLAVAFFGLFPTNILNMIQTSVSSWLVAVR